MFKLFKPHSNNSTGSGLWAKFADMHSHIIPGVDDGSPNIEESLRMIRISYASGVRCLYATPHIREGCRTNPQQLRQKLDELIVLKDKAGLTDMELRLGAEYMLDEEFMQQLPKGELLTLSENLILVENSFYGPSPGMKDMLFQIFKHGYIPVLAHPERYRYYQQDEKIYHTFKDQGCLFQLDLLSLQGAYGRTTRKTAVKLLKLGMIDYVGSDMHHVGHAQLLLDFLNSRDSGLLSSLYQ